MRAGWLVAVLGGCLHSTELVCDDGSICAPGASCLPSGGCRGPGCGDGVLDGRDGEECDDANALDHDGCSSVCRAERLEWTQVDGADIPSRFAAAAAWDPDRGRGLIVGGFVTGAAVNDAWSWTGTGWEAVPPPSPVTEGGALASDGRGALIFAGGTAGNNVFQDQCWLWTGTWQACAQPMPQILEELALAQDPAGGVIATGGLTGAPTDVHFSPDSYRRDAAGTWTTLPAGLGVFRHAAVLDARAGRVVRTGGSWFSGMSMTEALGATGWTAWAPEMNREPIAIAYDPNRHRITTIAGAEFTNPGDLGRATFEVIELVDDDPDPVRHTWVPIDPQPSSRPVPIRDTGQAFYDSLRHAFVLVGGRDEMSNYLGDTWLLRWTSDSPEEACDGSDNDGDGLIRCDDPDCWPRCFPRSPPGAPRNDTDPHCGDGVCNPALEDAALCPDDC